MELDRTNWRTDKVISLDEAASRAAEWRSQGKRLVTVNGAFDILHAGHLDQLEEAKKQGDILFVGINSDQSIKGYKGKDRPFFPEEARAAMLAALSCVDYVMIIDEEAENVPKKLIRTVRPNVHANGEEYGKFEQWIEWLDMQAVGAEGYVIRKRNDFSTSGLVDKIKKLD